LSKDPVPTQLINALLTDQIIRVQNTIDRQAQEAKLLQPTFYLGYDSLTGTNTAQVFGGAPLNQFRVITNAPLAEGDRVALRSSPALSRLDDTRSRRNQPVTLPVPKKDAKVGQGGVVDLGDGGFALDGNFIIGAFTWSKPLRSNFVLTFKFRTLTNDGISVSLTTIKDLNTEADFFGGSSLGVKPFPDANSTLNIDSGELVFGIDSYPNNPFDEQFDPNGFTFNVQARVFIFLPKFVPPNIRIPFDAPAYLDAYQVADIINRAGNGSLDTFRECTVELRDGQASIKIKDGTGIAAHFPDINLSVSLPAPAMGEDFYYQNKYLRINGSTFGSTNNNIVKDIKLVRR
jgi:hypothetical protein